MSENSDDKKKIVRQAKSEDAINESLKSNKNSKRQKRKKYNK